MACPFASTYQFGCGGSPSAMQYSGAPSSAAAIAHNRGSVASPNLKLHEPKFAKSDVVFLAKKKSTRRKRHAATKARRRPMAKKSPKGRKTRRTGKARW